MKPTSRLGKSSLDISPLTQSFVPNARKPTSLPPTINFVGTVILALCRSARRSKLVHKKKRIHSVNINFPIFQPELKQVNT